MKAIKFNEANTLFRKPDNMSDEECSSLPAYKDEKEIISVWQMSVKERIKVLLTGKIWFSVLLPFQPPICLSTNTFFIKPKKGKKNAE